MKYIETHIVDHCNLNCRGCSHFSPLASPYYKDLDEYKIEFERLAEITNHYIQQIRIMGGEPFLHPQVYDFCKITRELFPNSSIALVSNGVLLHKLSDEQIEQFNKLKIELCVSDYGINIDRDKFNKFHQRCFHNKNLMYNIGLDLNGGQPIDSSYYKCDHVYMGCNFLKDGRIYQCAISAQIDYFCNHFNKKIDYDLDDISIDIFSHTEDEILKFLSHPHDFCKYCDINKRNNSSAPFSISKGEITEWITQ